MDKTTNAVSVEKGLHGTSGFMPAKPWVPHPFLGAMIAIGYLLVVLLASLRRQDVANAEQVITLGGLCLVGGVAVIMLSLALGAALQNYIFAGLSLVLLILTSVLFSKLNISVGLTVLCGDGILGFAYPCAPQPGIGVCAAHE